MDAGFDDIFGDFIEAHGVIHGRGAEFGRVDDATLQRQIDFATGQRRHAGAQAVHDVHVPTRSTHPQPLEVRHFRGFLVGEQTHLLTTVATGQRVQIILPV